MGSRSSPRSLSRRRRGRAGPVARRPGLPCGHGSAASSAPAAITSTALGLDALIGQDVVTVVGVLGVLAGLAAVKRDHRAPSALERAAVQPRGLGPVLRRVRVNAEVEQADGRVAVLVRPLPSGPPGAPHDQPAGARGRFLDEGPGESRRLQGLGDQPPARGCPVVGDVAGLVVAAGTAAGLLQRYAVGGMAVLALIRGRPGNLERGRSPRGSSRTRRPAARPAPRHPSATGTAAAMSPRRSSRRMPCGTSR